MVFLYIFLVFAAIIIFMIFPQKYKGKSIFIKNKFIAHRGLHSKNIPENSIKSFAEAVKNGYIIENDIHITKDNQVIVFHDDTLKRMCGADKKIEELTLNEINEYSLLDSNEKIPTLKECLDEVDGKVPILIEFKCLDTPTCNRLCEEANKILNNYKGEYAIQSFYPFVLSWYRKNNPKVMRGQLASSFYKENISKKLLGALLFNFLARPNFVSYEYTHKNNFFLRLCILLGAYPVAWTYRKQEDINATKDVFKNFIFENFIPKKED